jgi:hypothetical protein
MIGVGYGNEACLLDGFYAAAAIIVCVPPAEERGLMPEEISDS